MTWFIVVRCIKKINLQLKNNITEFKDNLKKSYLSQNQKKSIFEGCYGYICYKNIERSKVLRDIKYKYCDNEKTQVEIVDKQTGQTT